MALEFRLPDGMAAAGAEGFVVHWFKDEGQAVKAGELLLEVQFEKVTSEVPAPVDGVLVRILTPRGAAVRAGQPLCLLAAAAEADSPAPAAGAPREVRATPAARRLARELGLDLAAVVGTGPGGRIGEEDVRRSAGPAPAAAPPATAGPVRVPLSPAQRVTAARVLQSLRDTAQFTLGREVDVTALVALRGRLKTAGSPITVGDLIHRAVVLALTEHPRLQAVWQGEELLLPAAIHLGFAVDRDGDLLVPVIRDAGSRSLTELAAERQRLAAAVRAGRVQAEDLRGATFTVSNLGPYGVDFFTPVLNPPQPAILGVGRTVARPVLRGGGVAAAQCLTLSLTVDHRVVNGAPAAAFLHRLADLLAAPAAWAEPG